MANFNYKDYLKNNPLLNEAQGDNDELDDHLGAENGKKKQDMKQRRADSENMEKAKGKRKYSGDKSKDKVKESYDDVDEEMRGKDVDEEMRGKDVDEEMRGSKKMTVKEFKASIREKILSEMNDDLDEADAVSFRRQNSPSYNADIDGGPVNPVPHKVGRSTVEEEEEIDEAEEVNVEDNEDINIDVEDDVNIDDVSDKSEIEVDSELSGESSDVSAILGLLTKAQEKAESMGDEKLLDQIGNTITYYTRAHVVK